MEVVVAYEVRFQNGNLDVFEFIAMDAGNMVVAWPTDDSSFYILVPNTGSIDFDVSATKYIKARVQDPRARVRFLGIFQDQFLVNPLV